VFENLVAGHEEDYLFVKKREIAGLNEKGYLGLDLAISEGGERIFFSENNKDANQFNVYEYDPFTQSMQMAISLDYFGRATEMATSKNGEHLIIAYAIHDEDLARVEIWDKGDSKWSRRGDSIDASNFADDEHRVGQSLGISDNGNTILVASASSVGIFKWGDFCQITCWYPVGDVIAPKGKVTDASMSPDGKFIAIAEDSPAEINVYRRSIEGWKRKGNKIQSEQDNESSNHLTKVEIVAGGTMVFTGTSRFKGDRGAVRVYDLQTNNGSTNTWVLRESNNGFVIAGKVKGDRLGMKLSVSRKGHVVSWGSISRAGALIWDESEEKWKNRGIVAKYPASDTVMAHPCDNCQFQHCSVALDPDGEYLTVGLPYQTGDNALKKGGNASRTGRMLFLKWEEVTPTLQPSDYPTITSPPSSSSIPSHEPSSFPSNNPTRKPSAQPSQRPSRTPSNEPSEKPSSSPSKRPSFTPSTEPSEKPSNAPSNIPSHHPSDEPSKIPTKLPSTSPSDHPSRKPSKMPSDLPSSNPSDAPSERPSVNPTDLPSLTPSVYPSQKPSVLPSVHPSQKPSNMPSTIPTSSPSKIPSHKPSDKPSVEPSNFPSFTPSQEPTDKPSVEPTNLPSWMPSFSPSNLPSNMPSKLPTEIPSVEPSPLPTFWPTTSKPPSIMPSELPSSTPTTLLQKSTSNGQFEKGLFGLRTAISADGDSYFTMEINQDAAQTNVIEIQSKSHFKSVAFSLDFVGRTAELATSSNGKNLIVSYDTYNSGTIVVFGKDDITGWYERGTFVANEIPGEKKRMGQKLAISDDGDIIMIASYSAVRCFRLRSTHTNPIPGWYQRGETLNFNEHIADASMTPDGKTIILSGFNIRVYKFSKGSWERYGNTIKKIPAGKYTTVKILPDGETLFAGIPNYRLNRGGIIAYDIKNNKWIRRGANKKFVKKGRIKNDRLGEQFSVSKQGDVVAWASRTRVGYTDWSGHNWVNKGVLYNLSGNPSNPCPQCTRGQVTVALDTEGLHCIVGLPFEMVNSVPKAGKVIIYHL